MKMHARQLNASRLMTVMIAAMLFVVVSRGEAQLVENLYSFTCPNVESIVKQAVINKLRSTASFTTIPATLRLFFHDCFVEGCDASVVIASPTGDAEKDAPDNLSLAGDGFDTVIKAKEAVEAECPGIVSCADILALAARDVIVLSGGPPFNVELGRRDGLTSSASRVAGNLPEPTDDVNRLTDLFARNNLTQIDMIALSGAHTIGFSHCSRFANRLYSFSHSSLIDPSLNPSYAQQLMHDCPQTIDPRTAVSMDPVTPLSFDNVYFQNLVQHTGMFTSDQVLFTNPATQPAVINFANNPLNFNAAFITAIRNLGRVGVKTGNQGEIRRDCTQFNS